MPSETQPVNTPKTFRITIDCDIRAESAIKAFHKVADLLPKELDPHTITVDGEHQGYKWDRYGRRADG